MNAYPIHFSEEVKVHFPNVAGIVAWTNDQSLTECLSAKCKHLQWKGKYYNGMQVQPATIVILNGELRCVGLNDEQLNTSDRTKMLESKSMRDLPHVVSKN